MHDSRTVMTLDAGGTYLKFSAIRDGTPLFDPIPIPSEAHDLERCLGHIVEGFELVRQRLPDAPAAISFAFPGPTDYNNGIVRDLPNLPGFRGGVALGPMLEERFGIPVFMNNDGDLFTYGEAIEGFLPWVNGLLEQAGSSRRYRNLLGITIGTGLGGGLVTDGRLFVGDNSAGVEVWLLRNKVEPDLNVERSANIGAVRRVYARQAGIPLEAAPEPRIIHEIALGETPGNAAAAREAFRSLGEAAGDAIGQALTLIDGLVVIGGGVSGASALFLPALVEAINGVYHTPEGPQPRLLSKAFNIEDPAQREAFLKSETREIPIPGSTKTVRYDPTLRVAVGISRLGTSHAVAVGAYDFALAMLDQRFGETHSLPEAP
jgi:glucokinase